MDYVSDPSLPVPQRIGDAERDQAVEFLREHLAQGRIDQTEFDERLDVALTARFADDLEPLFSDLPAPKPGRPEISPIRPVPPSQVAARSEPTVPARNGAMVALGTLAALAWPLAIMAMILLPAAGHAFWFIFLVPLLMSGAFGRYRGGHRR